MDSARIRSTVDKARTSVDKARTAGQEGVKTASDRWPPVDFAVETGRRFVRANGSVLAGHLTFRLFLLIVPVVLIIVAVLGYASASGSDLQAASETDLTFSKALADAITSTGDQARDSRLQTLLVGLFALLLAGYSLVKALRVIFAAVWRLPSKAQGSLPAVFGSVLVLVTILMATLAINRRLSRAGLVATGVGFTILILSGTLTILLLSWQLPRLKTRRVDLLPGALFAGVGFALLNTGAAWYFTHKLESSAQVYGALGVTVTMLTYLFLWSELLVLAAVVDTVWYDQVLQGERPDEDVEGLRTDVILHPPMPVTAPPTATEPEPEVEVAGGNDGSDDEPAEDPADEVTAVAAGAPRRRGATVRRVVTVPLAVLTASLLLSSAVAVWAHHTLLDTSGWQSTVVPLLQDPEIRTAVGDGLSDQIIAAVNVDDRARNLLPERALVLAPAISSGIDAFIRARVQDGLASDEVQQLWAEANARIHPKVVAFLRGEEVEGISSADGAVTLNLLPLVSRVLARIDQRAPGLLTNGRPLPTITAAMPEDQARALLGQALGVSLPDGFGVVTLPKSEKLAQVQRAVGLLDRLVIVLPLLFVVGFAALLLVAPNRRRALAWFGAAVLALAAAVLAGLRVGQSELVSDVQPAARQRAVIDAVAHVLGGLRAVGITMLVIGIVLALIAALTGERARDLFARGVALAREQLDGHESQVVTACAGVVAGLVVVWLVAASPTPFTFLLSLVLLAGSAAVIGRRQISEAVTGTFDLQTWRFHEPVPAPLPPPPAPEAPGGSGGSPDLGDDRADPGADDR